MIYVSILTTVYNGWEFLEECARSIYCQKSEYDGVEVEWEWLIGINGHGESGGPAMLAAAAAANGPRTRVKNLSQVRGRVEALEELRTYCSPKSEWIAILDCDDVWLPEKLILQAIAITRARAPIDVIGTFCEYFGERGGGPSLPGGWISPERIAQSNPIINSSALIRRELATWEDRFGLEDYDLWLRLARLGRRFFSIPHVLVRHRIHSDSAFNSSGKQRLPELLAFHRASSRPTVVSAYYPIASKNTSEQYMKWIEGFWPNMQCNLVFYTEPHLVSKFQEMFAGKRAVVVGLAFSELNAFRKLPASVWKDACALDTERNHSAELYALWYEKKEFVLRTIQANPFQSSKFVWCDAGIGRFPSWIRNIQGFPDETRIPLNRMVVLQIDPFQGEDSICGTDGIYGNFGTRSTVGGGILASGAEGWSLWSRAYDAVLLKYLGAGRFIGKDQNIMASVILEYPSLALTIQRPTPLGPIAGWFYLLIYLAGLQISS
jgi:glycosyltransferase involved in cell wall biosynthesis